MSVLKLMSINVVKDKKIPELSIRHGRVFVKQRGNEVRIDGHEEESHHHSEQPEIDEEVVAAPVDDFDDPGQDRRLDHLPDHKLLDLILDVETRGLFVKSMFLFQHELSVDTEWQPCISGSRISSNPYNTSSS